MQTANFLPIKHLPYRPLLGLIVFAFIVGGCGRASKETAAPTVEPLVTATVASRVQDPAPTPTATETKVDANAVVLASIKKQMKQSHLQFMGTVQEGSNATQMQVNYVAPDRLHFYMGPTEIIVISRKYYVSVNGQWMVAPDTVKAQLAPMIENFYEIPDVKNAKMVREEVIAEEQTALYEYEYVIHRDGNKIDQHGKTWIRLSDGLPVLNETTAAVDGKAQKTFFAFTYDGDVTVEEPTQIVQAPANVATQSSSNGIAGWQPFASTEGRFATLMPTAPTAKVNTLNTEAGAIDLYMFLSETRTGGYMVGYADYPPEIVKQIAIDDLLNGARDGMVANVKGTLLEELPATVDNYPGREFHVSINNGAAVVRSRIYLVNNRLYQLVAAVPAQLASTEEVSGFLDAFQLMQ